MRRSIADAVGALSARSLAGYVIDDTSTDKPSRCGIAKSKLWPRNVRFRIRRVAGGEGKAHTLNYGLQVLWRSDWTEAVADHGCRRDLHRRFNFDQDGAPPGRPLRLAPSPRTSRKEAASQTMFSATSRLSTSRPRVPLVARRTYSGFWPVCRADVAALAKTCLPSGANLQRHAGRRYFHHVSPQLKGRRAVFEPNAIVYAEEP